MDKDPDHLIAIWWPHDYWEATAIQEALVEQGIPCDFAGRSRLGSSEFHFGGIPTRQLYVRNRDAQRALAFIKAHDWPSYTPRNKPDSPQNAPKEVRCDDLDPPLDALCAAFHRMIHRDRPMTRAEYELAATKVRRLGSASIGIVGVLLTIAAIMLAHEFAATIAGLGAYLRQHIASDVLVGMVGGVLAGLCAAVVISLALLPAIWIDRRHGRRCDRCRRSLTLRCTPAQLLKTGECPFCHARLFEDR